MYKKTHHVKSTAIVKRLIWIGVVGLCILYLLGPAMEMEYITCTRLQGGYCA